jgi:hypothetical protein
MHYGEIYKLTSKTSGKSYIGQAKKYVGKYDTPWGTSGRWKSHISEAISSRKDHCVLLNNAIRKYGRDDFIVIKLCDCSDKNDMDAKEVFYIKEYGTLVPNGYNLNKGGNNGQDSQETRDKKRQAKLGKTFSEKTRKKISNVQLGNRRTKKERRFPEDNDLPKYIVANRKNGIIIGYTINSFPIGIHTKKYISKSFYIKIDETNDDTLERAKKCLNQLNKEYSYIKEEITKKKEIEDNLMIIATKKDIHKSQLPEYIYPVFHPEKQNKIGYYVKGVPDNNGGTYPKKEFTELQTNKWNLFQATQYILKCEIKNKDEAFQVPQDFETSRRRKYDDDDDNNLPKYVSIIRENGEKIGYNIAIPSITKPNGAKYTRKFTNKKLPMEEKLRICIETLNKVKQDYKIVD